MRAGPEEAAVEALAYLAEATGTFVVHLDVDVIDFVGLPVSDVPQINAGLTFREALACLEVFASSRRFTGLVVTEFNPDHADEEGETAMALVQGLVGAVTGGITRSLGQDTSRRPTT